MSMWSSKNKKKMFAVTMTAAAAALLMFTVCGGDDDDPPPPSEQGCTAWGEWTQWTVVTQATCQSAGSRTRTRTRTCDAGSTLPTTDTQNEQIPQLTGPACESGGEGQYCGWATGCALIEEGESAENPGMTNLQACQLYGTVYNSLPECETGEAGKVFKYCLWTSTGCSMITNPDGPSENAGLTNLQNCETNSGHPVFDTDAACEQYIIDHNITIDPNAFCDFGFGNIVAGVCPNEHGAPTTSATTPSSSGFYCDFGQTTPYGNGGCFFRPGPVTGTAAKPATGDACRGDCNDGCDQWAARVSMDVCIESNTLNECIWDVLKPGDGENPDPCECNSHGNGTPPRAPCTN